MSLPKIKQEVEFIPLGTPVLVKNYRSKKKDGSETWEPGKIIRVDFLLNEYNPSPNKLSLAIYTVTLDRQDDFQRALELKVIEDLIKPITDQPNEQENTPQQTR